MVCPFFKFHAGAGTTLLLVQLSLALEPLRYLSGLWMRRANDVSDPCKPHGLLDVVSPRYSPVTFALQYISTMLAGEVRRCQVPSGFLDR